MSYSEPAGLTMTAPRQLESAQRLRGNLGTFDIVFTVLAYNAPLTIIIGLIPVIIGVGNGLGAPLTYLAAGCLMLLFAVGFTTMARHVPNAGAYYAYITAGLGRSLGLGSAFMAILAYTFMLIGAYLYVGVTFSTISLSWIGLEKLPWWQWSLGFAAIVAVLGHFRISLSAKLLSLALVCEVIITFVWEAAVFQDGGANGLSMSWLTPEALTSGSIGLAVLFGVTCFAGFEATAIFREEARNPEVTIPRATYISIIAMSVMFASATLCFILGWGPEAALDKSINDPSNAGMAVVEAYLGNVGVSIVHTLVCTSIFACVLAIHNILARYIYSLSVDGVLFKSLSTVHPSHDSPYRASGMVAVITVASLLAAIYSGVEPYSGYASLVGIAGYTLLILQILTSVAVIVFFIKTPKGVSAMKTKVAPALALVGLSTTAWLATENIGLLTGSESVAMILLAFLFGSLMFGCVYALWLKRSSPLVYRAIGRQEI
ncbi:MULTISPECIES: APC family permease [Pseudomonas]|jgi:amino acid transporter|uniref:APC family permease n=1 Tax=Pseudomonas TaxID=286 RepID=UPI001E5A6E6D|nr:MULTISPECIES: APC family permease [Pseudomonas]UVM29266.1 APC family permease [Pseudomonas sp. B21-021]